MKKVLLSLALLLGASAAYADEVTFDFTGTEAYGMTLISSGNDYNPNSYTMDEGDVTMTLTGQTRWWVATNGNQLRFYTGSAFELSVPTGMNITKIEITGEKKFGLADGQPGSYENQTWEGSASSVKFNYTPTNKNGYITAVKVTYEGESNVTMPVRFSVAEGAVEPGTEVALTCSTEDAVIYYTLDGTDPSNASTEYTAPIAINEALTIKAIAYKGDVASVITKASYTLIEVELIAPTFNPASGDIYVGESVMITTATKGASIYYTLDGTDPTAASTLYTEPIEMTQAVESLVIKAVAIYNGESSEVSSAEYKVIALADGEIVALFTGWPTLFNVEQDGSGSVSKNTVDWNAQVHGVNLNVKNGDSTNTFLKADDFRVYKGYTLTFTAPANCHLVSILTEKAGKTFGTSDVTADNGTLSITNGNCSWVAGETPKDTVVWTISNTGSFKTITVTVEANSSAVESFDVELSAPVYYNLQGVRVDNPSNGIFIVRQGNKTSKVLVK